MIQFDLFPPFHDKIQCHSAIIKSGVGNINGHRVPIAHITGIIRDNYLHRDWFRVISNRYSAGSVVCRPIMMPGGMDNTHVVRLHNDKHNENIKIEFFRFIHELPVSHSKIWEQEFPLDNSQGFDRYLFCDGLVGLIGCLGIDGTINYLVSEGETK